VTLRQCAASPRAQTAVHGHRQPRLGDRLDRTMHHIGHSVVKCGTGNALPLRASPDLTGHDYNVFHLTTRHSSSALRRCCERATAASRLEHLSMGNATVKRRKQFVLSRFSGVGSAARSRADINFNLRGTARRLALAVGDRKGVMPSALAMGRTTRNALSWLRIWPQTHCEQQDGPLVQSVHGNCIN
jgi:hypothetical protein